MNQRPPQPPQPLDAEECALAKALPRLHGRSEPGPDLDTSILAAARAAMQPARATRSAARPRIGWIAPASLAASLLLAVGLAWRLRPLPVPVPAAEIAHPAMQVDAAGADDLQSMRMIEPPSAPQPVPMVEAAPIEQAKPAAAPPTATPAREQDVAPPNVPATSARDSGQSLQAMPAPPPAPASAPPPPAAASGAVTPEYQPNQRATSAAMAKPAPAKTLDSVARDASPPAAGKARMADGARQSNPEAARPVPVAPVVVNEAQMASDAGFVDDPDDSVPPATVDSPTVRDAWLQRIRQLLDQGNVKEAKASLAEFRRRYPDAALPAALQLLELEH